MMPGRKLARLVWRNSLRNRADFALSALGIVIGIASFVFFLGLSEGVRSVVLGDIFPLDQVEVIAPRTYLAGRTLAKKIDESAVESMRAQPGVQEAVPRMQLTFPANGQGGFDGKELRFEVGGFCDGIDPSYVGDESFTKEFQYWESDEHRAAQRACNPDLSCADPVRYYCDLSDNKCHHRVPVIVSNTLLELYNSSFAQSHGLPAIGGFETFVAQKGVLEQMTFRIGLGSTYVAGSNRRLGGKRRVVEAYLVGISSKAMPIGMTVPIQYVRDWNREFVGEDAATAYSSVIVRTTTKEEVAPFAAWVRNELGLELADQQGERFATAIFIVTLLFVLISFVIVGISAINIAHTFFMQVTERRRELGLMRAVGATRGDVRLIILGEASIVGVIGGTLGVAVAVGVAAAVDWAAKTLLPEFPFKPDSFFVFETWMLLGAVGFAIAFSVVGGYLPARRAARLEPARTLAER